MENREKATRGLERVYHYFLSTEDRLEHVQKVKSANQGTDVNFMIGLPDQKAQQKGEKKATAAIRSTSANNIAGTNVDIEMQSNNSNKEMATHDQVYSLVIRTVAKLQVLRDSCKGKLRIEKLDNNLIWFQGASAILDDVILNLKKNVLPEER